MPNHDRAVARTYMERQQRIAARGVLRAARAHGAPAQTVLLGFLRQEAGHSDWLLANVPAQARPG
eukprot:12173292-Alexandrium_andersonii.AAC.1